MPRQLLPGSIGALRQRIKIERNAPTKAADGQEVEQWRLLVDKVPAEVVAIAGQEVVSNVRGEQVIAVATSQITVRFRGDLTTEMRAIYDGRKLNFVRVFDPDGRKRKTVILATENA